MLRSILASLGDLFKNKLVDFGIGLVAVIFLLPEIRSPDDLSFINIRQIGIYVLIGVGVAAFFQVLGALCTWLSETMPAGISLSALPSENNAEGYVEYLVGETKPKMMVFNEYAPLLVRNNEPMELTDCYAVLKSLKQTSLNWDTYRRGKILSWKKHNECKISIGAYGGEQVLKVAELQYIFDIPMQEDATYSHMISFCFCGKNVERFSVDIGTTYEVGIEVHGKLGGREVRSPMFTGFIEVLDPRKGTELIKITSSKRLGLANHS